ncbi:alpha-2-macroglobulin, partial [bacterium]
SVVVSFNGRSSYHGFQVEEYRKPEYEISVIPSDGTIINGDELSFTVNAKYYFGEPVKDADVQYSIHARPHYWYGYARRYSWYYDERGYDRYYGGGDQVQVGEGKTDENGVLEIKVDNTKVDGNMLYTMRATVTEKGRRAIMGAGVAKVMRAEFNVSVKTDRYVAEPGDKVWITANAADHDGRPVSNAFHLEVVRIDWNSGKSKETKVLTRTIETDSEGKSRTPFTPDSAGYFRIRVLGADRRDNVVDAEVYLYVPGEGRRYWWSSGGGIEIIADRDEYGLGDEVTVLVNTPYEDAHALVTVEGTDLLGADVIHLEKGAGVYKFKIDRKHQPNVDFTVCIVRDGQLSQQSVAIVSPPVDKFADITIVSDKAEYRPGEKANVKVKAMDNEGRPIPVELSLGVVDESIYAIKPESTEDIRAAFYGRRYSGVNTQSSFWFYTYGDEGVEEESMMAEASMDMDMAAPSPEPKMMRMAGAPGKAMVEPEIRSDFPDTAYWRAHVVTGMDGTADVTFSVPDTLTTWRLTSRGVSKDTRVGQSVHKVISSKNVIVRLQTPRFFTQNDEQNITAVVHNYLDTEKDVQAILNVKGLRLLEKNEKWLKVPAGADVRVEWRAIVESPQDAWITVKALTDEESDAMQLTIPVLPHGSPGGDATAGEVDEEKVFTLTLPETYIKDTEKLTINLSPSLTAGMFDVLEYLAGYPYGCVEQTMSRFLPDVVIAEALQRAGRPLEGKLVDLPDMVAKGVERLTDFQHGDGGWGWWKDDETHPYMTAYVVMGLTRARAADFPVPDYVIERGGDALKVLLDKKEFENFDKEDFWNTRAYMVYALAEAGSDAETHAEKVYQKRDKLNDYGKAVLAIAMSKFGKKDRALTLIREMEKSAKVSKTSARWEGKSFRYGWSDNVVETTAFALMAFIEADPKNEIIPKAVRYLNLSRRGDHWYSTKDTAIAIMALTRYMSEYEDAKPDYSYTVSVNGAEVKSGVIKPADVSGTGIKIEMAEDIRNGGNEIKIVKKGHGNLYYYSSLNYFEGAERLEAQDNGIKIERWYSSDPEGEKRLKDGAQLKSGDVIWSHVKLDPSGAYDYVMVEDYLPSGFEVDKTRMDGGRHYRHWMPYYYVNREVRDEKVVSFYTRMWRDNYHSATPLRAEVPGKVAAMPCRAELMYFPEIGGRSAEARFVVKE